jgi:15-cis-phytoene synthase
MSSGLKLCWVFYNRFTNYISSMFSVYNTVSEACSKITTTNYSTSFSSAIKTLHPDLQVPIFNIYGFVRFADEIVDTFHQFDKAVLLDEFITETNKALDRRISTNPILHSFQRTVHQYNIDKALIDAFFTSMTMDLNKQHYNKDKYETYIYGSAEVVGLMCLYVFCDGNLNDYKTMEPYAQALGAAFQKVNFLRDLKADYLSLDRVYFPNIDFKNFSYSDKEQIEADIANDFRLANIGIKMLPWKARFGVYVAYKYYLSLFEKIRKTQPQQIMNERIRVPDYQKAYIFLRASVKNQLNLI